MSFYRLENPDVEFLIVKCKCGHSMTFTTKHPRLCTWCGRKVYPNKKMWFEDKLKVAMIKEKKKDE